MKTNVTKVLQIVWLAMFGSGFTYMYIARARSTEFMEINLEGYNQPMIRALLIVSVIIFAVALIVPDLVAKNTLSRRDPSGSLQLRSGDGVYNIFFVPYVLRFAFCEAINIFGLIVALRFGFESGYPFWGLGSLAFLLAFPAARKMEALVEEARQSKV